MKTMRKPVLLSACLLLSGLLASAQEPLARPLADFDKLVSQLQTGSVVGEPVRVGDTAIVPFAKISFGLGAGEAIMGFGGGMGGKTIPLGVLIVEGDDVSAELYPEQEDRPAFLKEIVQTIQDRKLVIMGNGINLGGASGNIQDLAPLISALMGQTTVMGNVLNLGSLKAPGAAAAPARKHAETLAAAEALVARKPSPEAYYYLGEAFRNSGMTAKAAAAYKKALQLQPNYPEAAKALAAIK